MKQLFIRVIPKSVKKKINKISKKVTASPPPTKRRKKAFDFRRVVRLAAASGQQIHPVLFFVARAARTFSGDEIKKRKHKVSLTKTATSKMYPFSPDPPEKIF